MVELTWCEEQSHGNIDPLSKNSNYVISYRRFSLKYACPCSQYMYKPVDWIVHVHDSVHAHCSRTGVVVE